MWPCVTGKGTASASSASMEGREAGSHTFRDIGNACLSSSSSYSEEEIGGRGQTEIYSLGMSEF